LVGSKASRLWGWSPDKSWESGEGSLGSPGRDLLAVAGHARQERGLGLTSGGSFRVRGWSVEGGETGSVCCADPECVVTRCGSDASAHLVRGGANRLVRDDVRAARCGGLGGGGGWGGGGGLPADREDSSAGEGGKGGVHDRGDGCQR